MTKTDLFKNIFPIIMCFAVVILLYAFNYFYDDYSHHTCPMIIKVVEKKDMPSHNERYIYFNDGNELTPISVSKEDFSNINKDDYLLIELYSRNNESGEEVFRHYSCNLLSSVRKDFVYTFNIVVNNKSSHIINTANSNKFKTYVVNFTKENDMNVLSAGPIDDTLFDSVRVDKNVYSDLQIGDSLLIKCLGNGHRYGVTWSYEIGN